jgi:biotin transporter BioY
MKIWRIIKAPIAVQFNRIVFALYAVFFICPMWEYRRICSPKGWIIFSVFLFFSLLGFFYSCVRTRRSRWIMSAIIILIPAVFLTGMFYMGIFSSPQTWWDWLLEPLPFFVWLAIPVTLAYLLFKNKRAKEYFTDLAA